MNYATKEIKGYLFVSATSDKGETFDKQILGENHEELGEQVWGRCDKSCIAKFVEMGWTVGGIAQNIIDYLSERGTLKKHAKLYKELETE